MATPTWAEVLDVMYEEEKMVEYSTIEDRYSIPGIFLEKTGLAEGEVEAGFIMMEEFGLREDWGHHNEEHAQLFRLTEKGFDVAHERELAKRQDKTNAALVLFTFVLILVGIAGNIPNSGGRLVANLVVVIGLVWMVQRTEVLNLTSL